MCHVRGAITQLVECHNGIVKATGSSPVSSIFLLIYVATGSRRWLSQCHYLSLKIRSFIPLTIPQVVLKKQPLTWNFKQCVYSVKLFLNQNGNFVNLRKPSDP